MDRTTDAPPRADAGIAELLAHRARHASDARLVLDAAGGIVVAGVLAVVRGPGWVMLTCAALCFTAFGAWGIVDRELAERVTLAPGAPHRGLRAARVAAIVLGCGSAAGAALAVLGALLGTWIS